MCNPAAGFAIASMLVTAYGQKKQADYQVNLSQYNQKVETQKAGAAIQAGETAAEQQRQRVRQAIGAQTAAQGASGAQVGVGTFGDITDQTARLGEQDAQTIRLNAARNAWGINAQGLGDQLSGAAAKSAGDFNTASTLLQGSSKAYGYAVNWGK